MVTFRDPATTSLKTSFQELIALRIATGNSHPVRVPRKPNPWLASLAQPNKKPTIKGGTFVWWVMRDSNPRPPRCKRGALAN